MENQIGVTEATGETWKSIKKSASGPFSLIRLKKSILLYNECNKHMIDYIDRQLSAGNDVIDSSNLLSNVSMDVLASVGLGVNINSFEDPDNEFKAKVDNIFDIRGIYVMANLFVHKVSLFKKSKVMWITFDIEILLRQTYFCVRFL